MGETMREGHFFVEDDVMARQQIESTQYIKLDDAMRIFNRLKKELIKNARKKQELA